MTTFIKSALLALGATLPATSVAANQHSHTVHIYDDGFFPTRIYVNRGDTIQYVNKTGYTINMEVPYYFSSYWGLYEDDFQLSNNATHNVQIWLDNERSVNAPDGGEDGFIMIEAAPREGSYP